MSSRSGGGASYPAEILMQENRADKFKKPCE